MRPLTNPVINLESEVTSWYFELQYCTMAEQNSNQIPYEACLIADLPTDVQQEIDTNNLDKCVFLPLSFILWQFCYLF